MVLNRNALFDIDGTLADYEGSMRLALEKIDDKPLPENFHSDGAPEWLKARIELVRAQAGWWANLPVIQSGLKLMRLCVEIGYDVHILTQGPRNAKNAWSEKFEWCDRHVSPISPDYGINITRGGKGLYYGRVLVDDYPEYMLSWLEHRKRGLGLMPEMPWNQGFSHRQVVKYNPEPDKWRTAELEDKLRAAFSRKPKENIF